MAPRRPGGGPAYAWPFVERYFSTSEYRLTEHQLDSYNDFVDRKIAGIIRGNNGDFVMKKDRDALMEISNNLRFQVTVGEPSVSRPVVSVDGNPVTPLYPNTARLLDADYSLVVAADVEIRALNVDTGEEVLTVFPSVKLGEVPLMLHSAHCYLKGLDADGLSEIGEDPWDRGGYFVHGGQESVIVSQEDASPNRPIVRAVEGGPDIPGVPRPSLKLTYGSAPRDDLIRPVATHLSTHPAGPPGTAAAGLLCVRLQVVPIASDIDVAAVFRALGAETDLEIAECVLGRPVPDPSDPGNGLSAGDLEVLGLLKGSLAVGHTLGAWTRTQALEHIAPLTPYGSRELRMAARRYNVEEAKAAAVRRGTAHALWIFNNNLLPSAGTTSSSYPKKRAMLGGLVRRLLLTAAGVMPLTDRESFAEKRVRLAGPLLATIFEEAYRDFKREAINRLDLVFYKGPVRTTGNIGALVTPDKVDYVFNPSIVSGVMNSSFKGNWGAHRGHPTRSSNAAEENGIVLLSERNSYIGFASRAKKVNNPLDGKLKLVSPRHLHGTQYGAVCPVDSPDGSDVGLAKNLAIMCKVTSDVDTKWVIRFLEGAGRELFSPLGEHTLPSVYRALPGRALVLVNGDPVGFSDSPGSLVAAARKARRLGVRGAGDAAEVSDPGAEDVAGLDAMTSVCFVPAEMEVRFSCDGGRCCRPLLRIPATWSERGLRGGAEAMRDRCLALLEADPGWDSLFFGGGGDREPYLEYVDAEEIQSSCVVASDFDAVQRASETQPTTADPSTGAARTHVELHPSTVFSVYTVTSPLMQHNQCTRNVFAAQQGKHAASVYSLAHRHRMEVGSPVLNAGQRPILTTRFERLVGSDAHPNGENAVVAVMCYSGYNQEDGVLLNRAAVERGAFSLTYYSTESVDDEVGQSVQLVVGIPRGQAPPPNLDDRGLPVRNAPVREGQPLVGVVRRSKVSLGNEDGAAAAATASAALSPDGARAVFVEEDASPLADEHRVGKFVDRAVSFAKPNMRRTTKVRYRKWRSPGIGDKMASRHGQKGVIGFLLAPEDMPFTADGLVPDIIVNPHAFPSRMTLGHLMESLGAKAACMAGAKADGTMFEPFDTESSARVLGKYGYHPGGEEIMYCGRTGRTLEASVFVGPTYYQRLKQVVEDKINYRGSRGPVTAISRQPSQGRRNGGGQRLGEMEMDSIKAHGVACFLAESITKRSDGASVWTDGGGVQASFNEREDRFASLADPDDTFFEKRLVPRAFVTLVHELYGMGVDARMTSHAPP